MQHNWLVRLWYLHHLQRECKVIFAVKCWCKQCEEILISLYLHFNELGRLESWCWRFVWLFCSVHWWLRFESLSNKSSNALFIIRLSNTNDLSLLNIWLKGPTYRSCGSRRVFSLHVFHEHICNLIKRISYKRFNSYAKPWSYLMSGWISKHDLRRPALPSQWTLHILIVLQSQDCCLWEVDQTWLVLAVYNVRHLTIV